MAVSGGWHQDGFLRMVMSGQQPHDRDVMTAASEWWPWDGSVRTAASGQWYQDGAVRKTNFLKYFSVSLTIFVFLFSSLPEKQ